MKAYLVNGSPNCRKVQATIAYLGCDIETQYMDFFSGELKQDSYLSIDPNGTVPALVDGDLKLWESNAICIYLAETFGESQLFPEELSKRIEVLRWQFWETNHFNRATGALVWEYFAKPLLNLGDPDPDIVKQALADFHRYAPVLDQQLHTNAYVAGDELTLADFSVACLAGEWDQSQVPYQDYPSIVQWRDRLDMVAAWRSCAPPPLAEIGKAVSS